jgi:NAD(P)-dependent dehydrogenase (short-subunit alcohol dehydrogenase family)
MDRLKAKTAIVTGGANGIGLSVCRTFAAEGALVVIADLDAAAGEEAAAGMRSLGQRATFCRTDVASATDVARAVEMAASAAGRIDILCNNAAYLGEFHAILESTPEEWERCIKVTLLGTHEFTKQVLPFMISQRCGSIVNVVSIQAMVGCPASAAYTATKAALIGYTLSAAHDYGPSNIRVNALCPGPIQTRISPKPGDPAFEWQCSQTVLGRVGQPQEVAYAALFLASDEASYITGATLPVDGGWTSK